MDQAVSRNGVPIRLTEERWFHIVENHDDLAGYYYYCVTKFHETLVSCGFQRFSTLSWRTLQGRDPCGFGGFVTP